jgi:hypothetical protein
VIVDPPFRDGCGGDGLSDDEHPLGDVRLGQAWMASSWSRTASVRQPRQPRPQANNVGQALDFSAKSFEPADLPDPADPVTQPCSTRDDPGRNFCQEHVNDLETLEHLAERYGFQVGDGKLQDILTEPDRIRRAVEQSRQGAAR